MDTVEKNVEGLADMIIAEDAERRAEELVRRINLYLLDTNNHLLALGFAQYRAETTELGSEARFREKAGKA